MRRILTLAAMLLLVLEVAPGCKCPCPDDEDGDDDPIVIETSQQPDAAAPDADIVVRSRATGGPEATRLSVTAPASFTAEQQGAREILVRGTRPVGNAVSLAFVAAAEGTADVTHNHVIATKPYVKAVGNENTTLKPIREGFGLADWSFTYDRTFKNVEPGASFRIEVDTSDMINGDRFVLVRGERQTRPMAIAVNGPTKPGIESAEELRLGDTWLIDSSVPDPAFIVRILSGGPPQHKVNVHSIRLIVP